MKIRQKILPLLLAAARLAGCTAPADTSVQTAQTPQSARTDTLQVVATIYPVYDWVRQVVGEDAPGVEVTLLQDGGTDLHSYQPSAADLAAIADCDLLVDVGGASDAWVEDALQNAANPERRALDLMELLGTRVYEEETVEGMQPEGTTTGTTMKKGKQTNISGLRCATRRNFPPPLPIPWPSWTRTRPPSTPATPSWRWTRSSRPTR